MIKTYFDKLEQETKMNLFIQYEPPLKGWRAKIVKLAEKITGYNLCITGAKAVGWSEADIAPTVKPKRKYVRKAVIPKKPGPKPKSKPKAKK